MRYRRRFNQRTGYPHRDAPAKVMPSRYAGTCHDCGQAFAAGDLILWQPSSHLAYAMACELTCGQHRQQELEQAQRDREAAEFDEEANATIHAM